MGNRKITRKYYFTVDGETEQWYFEWLAKQINCTPDATCLGYSNFTFELWVVLHKEDCFGALSHRSQYLVPINRAFGENFENLDQYKHENNFKRVLQKLCLQSVRDAVYRSRSITDRNHEHGYSLHQYKGYTYYRENPSLSLWESIEKILFDCGLMEKSCV